jgi:hypothetical protein
MPQLPDAFRLHYDIQYVGKLIKSAKRKVTFAFAFAGDDDSHSLVLSHTLNSGRKVIHLNGTNVFEEESLSMGQFVYPLQLDGHLLTVTIEALMSDEDNTYDIRIDGVSFRDLRTITLTELRSGKTRSGGGGGGRPAARTGGGDAWAIRHGRDDVSSNDDSAWEAKPEEDDFKPTASLNDFVGQSAAPTHSAKGAASASWEPFSAEVEFNPPAPAPAPVTRRAPAPAPAAFDPFADMSSAPTPSAAISSRRASGGPVAQKAAPISTSSSLSSDFAGLSFSPAPASYVQAPQSNAVDIFSQPVAPIPQQTTSRRSSAVVSLGDPTSDSLFNLDNLTAAPKGVAGGQSNAARPTLGQLAASSGAKPMGMMGGPQYGAPASGGGLDSIFGAPAQAPVNNNFMFGARQQQQTRPTATKEFNPFE